MVWTRRETLRGAARIILTASLAASAGALAAPAVESPPASPPAAAPAPAAGSSAATPDPAAASDAPTPADAAVLQAKQAFQRGQSATLQSALARVRGHPLEPLVAYWDMRLGLETASPERIRAYLAQWAGSYYEDRLRNDWLRLLGLRQDWHTFLQEWPHYRMRDDPAVRCHLLHARLATQGRLDAAEIQEAASVWLAQKDAETACTALIERLLARQLLPASLAWQRARLGTEADRPAVVRQALGLLSEDTARAAARIIAQPEAYLLDKLTAVRQQTKELVTLALIGLARTDPEAAASHLQRARWRVQLTAEEQSWVWGLIGKVASQRLMPQALAWFAHGKPEHMHPEHLGWWVRAALRQSDWEPVARITAAMPSPIQDDPTWTYWRARALLAQRNPGATAQATELLARIANPHDFYGQLALEELGQRIQLPPRPAAPSAAEMRAARDNPGLQRALAAIALGLRAEGVREWNYTTNLHTPGGMDDRQRLAAAELACQHEIWDRCIATSERTRGFADHTQRYPLPLRERLSVHASAAGLDLAYVYGLIRQESRFILDARSHVGASGLMQIMPATAKWTARKIGLKDFAPSDIFERETNLRIGTAYLKLVLDDFGGSLPLAAAAYNAGPGRPRQWRAPGGSGPVLEGAIWAETIPFAETRDYVKKVLANTTIYAAILTGQPQSLKARLGTVGPRSAQESPPDRELP